jgi:hypothetical protein
VLEQHDILNTSSISWLKSAAPFPAICWPTSAAYSPAALYRRILLRIHEGLERWRAYTRRTVETTNDSD